MIVAHVGGLPVEELLPAGLVGATTLLAALRVRLVTGRRRSRLR